MRKQIFFVLFVIAYCGAIISCKQNPASETTINGHEYVDLGLSVKWATCNVGAEKPSDYGNYYAWGEIVPKLEYSVEKSVTYGKDMESIAGDPKYDAARANWEGTWRMPTKEEIEELIIKCKLEWTTQGGHAGYKVTGPNGNSIFLPAASWLCESSSDVVGKSGYYWSATPGEDNMFAYGLFFADGGPGIGTVASVDSPCDLSQNKYENTHRLTSFTK